MKMNELTWIEPPDIHTLITPSHSVRLKKAMHILFEKFDTPIEWLNSSDKTVIIDKVGSELAYMLYWFNQSEIWQDDDYKLIVMNYILENTSNRLLLSIAIRLELLSDEEIRNIQAVDERISVRKIGAMCILLNKPLKEFTDTDIESFAPYKGFYEKLLFSKKRLYGLRVALGYSNKTITRITRKTNWDRLCLHEKYGDIFKQYKAMLESMGTRKNLLTQSASALVILLNFMEAKGIDSFSEFNSKTFEQLIDSIASSSSPQSAGVMIPKIKNFFKLNIGEEMFPKELDFCDTFWTNFTRKVKKLNAQTDGLAFSDIELPNKIINILNNFTPNNEQEHLCKEFWLIISSSPVRFNFLRTLRAEDAIKQLPNNPNAYGLYSPFHDKAGNKFGQFPILDQVGLKAVQRLQERAKSLKLQPLYNEELDSTYVHLFQLTASPWILNQSAIRGFYDNIVMSKIKLDYPDDAELRASAHSFRHFLITHVAMKTGDELVCQTAAGHKNVKMTQTYLRSKASRNSLLLRVVDKYEQKEITGKFYLKLVELLTSENVDADHILFSVSSEMKVDNFLETYGRKTDIGYCFSNEECSKWHACWGCNNFVMTKNEITAAIKILCYQIVELKSLTLCNDFSYELPTVKNKIRLITLIIKRLTELGISEDEVNIMTGNYFNKLDILTGVE